jgi:hypothetical protein
MGLAFIAVVAALWQPVGMRNPLALGLIAVVAACASTPVSFPPPSGPLSASWLAGGWVPEGESCASEAGIVYRSDGKWFAEGVAGSWRIEGSRIVTWLTERWEDGRIAERLAEPERSVQLIQVTGPDSYISRPDDGSVYRMSRCPGVAE